MKNNTFHAEVKATKIVKIDFQFTSETEMSMKTFYAMREEAYKQFRIEHPELADYIIYIQEIKQSSGGVGVF